MIARIPGARSLGRLRIGLLGGSFNPAHDGHRHISELALARLRLDQVWWLVSPQNPLKPVRGMASFSQRLQRAAKSTNDPRIRVSGLEASLRTRYTIDTLRALRRRYPRVRFVWLMGADNLGQFPRWRAWEAIVRTVPIAVFARPPYSKQVQSGKVAHRFLYARIRQERAGVLADRQPPAWAFMHTLENAASATRLRKSPSG